MCVLNPTAFKHKCCEWAQFSVLDFRSLIQGDHFARSIDFLDWLVCFTACPILLGQSQIGIQAVIQSTYRVLQPTDRQHHPVLTKDVGSRNLYILRFWRGTATWRTRTGARPSSTPSERTSSTRNTTGNLFYLCDMENPSPLFVWLAPLRHPQFYMHLQIWSVEFGNLEWRLLSHETNCISLSKGMEWWKLHCALKYGLTIRSCIRGRVHCFSRCNL